MREQIFELTDKQKKQLEKLNPNLCNYIKSPDISKYILKLNGNLDLLFKPIISILKNKNIKDEDIKLFKKFCMFEINTLDELFLILKKVINPPFNILDTLDKITNIEKICEKEKLKNIEWLLRFKFNPNPPHDGNGEAFINLFFQNISNAIIGDLLHKTKELLEVKANGGRIMGQTGIKNITKYIDELLKKLKYKIPKNKNLYDFKTNTINILERKIKIKKEKLIEEKEKYNFNLLKKKEKMDQASKNKNTKKYKDAEYQYKKYDISEKIKSLEKDIKNLNKRKNECILENISINLAKDSIDKSIEFFTKIFLEKYTKSDKNKIIKLFKLNLNDNGSFKESFAKEYLIFSYEYYQFIENFNLFTIINVEGKIILTINSLEMFKKYVYRENIFIKSFPCFGEQKGPQGKTFSIGFRE